MWCCASIDCGTVVCRFFWVNLLRQSLRQIEERCVTNCFIGVRLIDLRSDTVTRPSPEMLTAMVAAPTGDDVYGEDPTVNALEQLSAEMTGKEAALFVSSGTQGNLLAQLSHCRRGDEYIAGMEAHTYRYEAGGAAVLGGIQPQPIPFNDRGELDLSLVERPSSRMTITLPAPGCCVWRILRMAGPCPRSIWQSLPPWRSTGGWPHTSTVPGCLMLLSARRCR